MEAKGEVFTFLHPVEGDAVALAVPVHDRELRAHRLPAGGGEG